MSKINYVDCECVDTYRLLKQDCIYAIGTRCAAPDYQYLYCKRTTPTLHRKKIELEGGFRRK